jgi:hypothetical protein
MTITHRTGELNLIDLIYRSNDVTVCEDNLFEITKFSSIKICNHLYDSIHIPR